MDAEKIIELTFKIVVILASLGVASALIKKAFGKVKRYLTIEQRLTRLENNQHGRGFYKHQSKRERNNFHKNNKHKKHN